MKLYSKLTKLISAGLIGAARNFNSTSLAPNGPDGAEESSSLEKKKKS